MTTNYVAQEILRQIGGIGRLSIMIGAANFVASDNSVSFTFKARARDQIKGVRIVLEPSDVYTVEFIQVSQRFGRRVFRTVEGVYCDMLKGLIEQTTGLALSLR